MGCALSVCSQGGAWLWRGRTDFVRGIYFDALCSVLKDGYEDEEGQTTVATSLGDMVGSLGFRLVVTTKVAAAR